MSLKDKRIKILVNKKILELGYQGIKELKNQEGEYIAFLDADDLWLKDKIKNQISFMKQKNNFFTHKLFNY